MKLLIDNSNKYINYIPDSDGNTPAFYLDEKRNISGLNILFEAIIEQRD